VVHDANESTISDCFPNEQLFRVQEEQWYADIVNLLGTGEMPGGWNKNDRDHFLFRVRFFIWDDPYNIIRTRLLDVVFPMSIFKVSFLFAMINLPMSIFKVSFLFSMINLVEDTLVEKRPLRRFFKADSIGRPYLEMPMNIVNDACIVDKWVK